MPSGYDNPGPRPEQVLEKVIRRLHVELKDPYSIRDLTICELEQTKASVAPFSPVWRRSRWFVRFALNSKNAYGGYTGSTPYYAFFDNGDVAYIEQGVLSELIVGRLSDLSLADLNREMTRARQPCPKVADEAIQALLRG